LSNIAAKAVAFGAAADDPDVDAADDGDAEESGAEVDAAAELVPLLVLLAVPGALASCFAEVHPVMSTPAANRQLVKANFFMNPRSGGCGGPAASPLARSSSANLTHCERHRRRYEED
jgi:hypothetical protein